MGIDWENYPPKGEPGELAVRVTRHITTEFLANGMGTSAHKTKVDLDKDYTVLHGLIEARLIRMTGTAYFPCFQSLYYMDPPTRTLGEESLGWVFKALRYLHKNMGPNEYSMREIVEAANLITSRPIDHNIIRLGMHFAIEFELFFSSWSGDAEQPVKKIAVDDRILLFSDVVSAWTQEQARRSPRPVASPQSRDELKRTGKNSDAIEDDPLGLFGPSDFSFVKDVKLREIIERDYAELETIRRGVKSRIILAGGLIEGFLLDALLGDQTRAREAKSADKKDLREWNLATLIDVALELGLISQGPRQHGQAVRNFRNLVHPGKETRGDYVVGQHEAHAAELALRMVIRDLRARNRGTHQ